MDETMSFRKIVMHGDLNPSNRLFGGRIMEWLDEAAAIYATSQLKTNRLVTLKVSQLIFKSPARLGDVVEFFCHVYDYGTSSFTVKVVARTKKITTDIWEDIVSAELVFVTIDNLGTPRPHNFEKENG
jgi:acyl-CoA hydrolase